MSEWWTYSLSSFLLFSPKTYYRLFELYNREFWPAQLGALALGAWALAGLPGRAPWRGRLAAAVLAAAWAWVAWAYLAERYATINWAAGNAALGFALQALLLLWCGVVRDGLAGTADGRAVRAAGFGMAAFALLLQPLLAVLLGRPWQQMEWFGMAPDPTVAATLGILGAARRPLWPLLVIPLAWCLVSGATLWAMAAREALLMPGLALLAVALAIRKSQARAAAGD